MDGYDAADNSARSYDVAIEAMRAQLEQPREFLDGKVRLYGGDCRTILAALPESSIDSVVTDPPYGLEFMGRDWDSFKPGYKQPQIGRADGSPMRRNAGTPAFTADGNPTCKNCGGDKYRNGPRKCGCERPHFGNPRGQQMRAFQEFCEQWAREVYRVLKPGGHLVAFSGTRTYHRMACAIEDAGFEIRDQIGWAYGSGFPKSHNIGNGWGTALKPAWEPICLARKPLIGTVAENVLRHGTGALNIDGCRVETDDITGRQPYEKDGDIYEHGSKKLGSMSDDWKKGRWPANLVHDGSEEVLAGFPETTSGALNAGHKQGAGSWGAIGGDTINKNYGNDSGSAARFFYTAKADGEDRLGSKHPTVKPLDLMQWLVRLVTPKGGTVLDPFGGTGTTGEAAWREGMRAILIEREAEYQADIERRMELATKPTKRAAVAKTKNKLDNPNELPLFSEGLGV